VQLYELYQISLQNTIVFHVGADWFYVHKVNLNQTIATATETHCTFDVHWPLSDVCLLHKLVITKT
jgi:hypothetical protein